MATATFVLHALIKEARRRALKRRWMYAGVLALLAGSAIWGGLALNGGSVGVAAPPAPPGYHLVRARSDVQHALLASSYRGAVNGYPAGKLRAAERSEVWLDRRTGLVRTRGCRFGRCSDDAYRCVPYCGFSVSLLERYWPVDTTKFVRRPGLGTFHGRRVIWLGKLENTFAPRYRNGEWIALDPRTHDAIADRTYGTTDKPLGQILGETWVVKRFPDLPSNRFWFPVKNRGLDVRFTRLQPVPLYVPGSLRVPDLDHATRIVVGRLARATIFASPTRRLLAPVRRRRERNPRRCPPGRRPSHAAGRPRTGRARKPLLESRLPGRRRKHVRTARHEALRRVRRRHPAADQADPFPEAGRPGGVPLLRDRADQGRSRTSHDKPPASSRIACAVARDLALLPGPGAAGPSGAEGCAPRVRFLARPSLLASRHRRGGPAASTKLDVTRST